MVEARVCNALHQEPSAPCCKTGKRVNIDRILQMDTDQQILFPLPASCKSRPRVPGGRPRAPRVLVVVAASGRITLLQKKMS
jgi:hypothetical protein